MIKGSFKKNIQLYNFFFPEKPDFLFSLLWVLGLFERVNTRRFAPWLSSSPKENPCPRPTVYNKCIIYYFQTYIPDKLQKCPSKKFKWNSGVIVKNPEFIIQGQFCECFYQKLNSLNGTKMIYIKGFHLILVLIRGGGWQSTLDTSLIISALFYYEKKISTNLLFYCFHKWKYLYILIIILPVNIFM